LIGSRQKDSANANVVEQNVFDAKVLDACELVAAGGCLGSGIIQDLLMAGHNKIAEGHIGYTTCRRTRYSPMITQFQVGQSANISVHVHVLE
jgi:hypothetical protein